MTATVAGGPDHKSHLAQCLVEGRVGAGAAEVAIILCIHLIVAAGLQVIVVGGTAGPRIQHGAS
jgi:hypothetical protein